jgi:glycosyltransferase involved in cell wall biosynthesis
VAVEGLPQVSVVVPAFNYARYVGEAVESVLGQTWGGFEVIVVDDGSTDGTRQVVEAIGDERVRYVYQRNAGLPAARNTGIRMARHEVVGFLDADDLWWPEFLEVALRELVAEGGRRSMVACLHTWMDPRGTHLRKSVIGLRGGEMRARDIAVRSRFNPSTVLAWKRCLVEAGWFDETLTSVEDRDLWVRVAGCGPVWLIRRAMVTVRVHAVSMSRNPGRMAANAARMLAKVRASADGSRWGWFFWRWARAAQAHENAWMYHDAGKQGAAIWEEFKSWGWMPWVRVPSSIFAPPFFRLRAVVRFVAGWARGLGRGAAGGGVA